MAATQKQYFEYGSRIRSKESAEAFAITNGIGAIYGFNKATIDTGRKIIKLGRTMYGRYITDRSNAKQNVTCSLITPDGIVTSFNGDIEVNVPDLAYGEYLIYATHNYVEAEGTVNSVTFGAVKGTNLVKELVTDTVTIQSWYTKIKSLSSGFNDAASVIVALVDYQSSGTKVYTPYFNEWPSEQFLLDKMKADLYKTIQDNVNNLKELITTTDNKVNNLNLISVGGFEDSHPVSGASLGIISYSLDGKLPKTAKRVYIDVGYTASSMGIPNPLARITLADKGYDDVYKTNLFAGEQYTDSGLFIITTEAKDGDFIKINVQWSKGDLDINSGFIGITGIYYSKG